MYNVNISSKCSVCTEEMYSIVVELSYAFVTLSYVLVELSYVVVLLPYIDVTRSYIADVVSSWVTVGTVTSSIDIHPVWLVVSKVKLLSTELLVFSVGIWLVDEVVLISLSSVEPQLETVELSSGNQLVE